MTNGDWPCGTSQSVIGLAESRAAQFGAPARPMARHGGLLGCIVSHPEDGSNYAHDTSIAVGPAGVHAAVKMRTAASKAGAGAEAELARFRVAHRGGRRLAGYLALWPSGGCACVEGREAQTWSAHVVGFARPEDLGVELTREH